LPLFPILLDLRMPGRGGSEVIAELRAVDPSMTLVVLTGYGSIAIAISAVKKGAARVEWEHLQCGIPDCGGNISQAAWLPGIHRRSLR